MKNEKGFTLVEILVVVAILGIIAIMAFTNVFGLLSKSKEQILEGEANKIKEAAVLYVEDYCDNPIGDNECSDSFKNAITYKDENGNTNTTTVSETYDTNYKFPEDSKREGYIFEGWYTNTNYNTKVTEETVFKKTSKSTLYAKWTAIQYYIVYDGNGETSGTMSNSKHTYDNAKKLTANSYKKTGYTFDGWSTTKNGDVIYTNQKSVKNLSSVQGATITLYAHWSVNSYKITLNANGGKIVATDTDGWTNTSDNKNSTKMLTYGTKYGVLPKAEKTNCTFAGWYTDTNYKTQITSTTDVSVTSAKTYYAKWIKN